MYYMNPFESLQGAIKPLKDSSSLGLLWDSKTVPTVYWGTLV